MTQEQIDNFQVIAPLVNSGALPTRIAASMLKISQRQLQRWLEGQGFAVHKAWNRITDEVRDYVKDLKQENPNYNCQWISELTSDHFGGSVSQTSVWRILKNANLLGAKALVKIARSRFEAKGCGDIVQLDTTWGYWLDGKRLNLILLLDDYSRYILAAEFFWEDSAYNNMLMIRKVAEDYGGFKVLYTDNASFFKAIRHNQSRFYEFSQGEYESEITQACRGLGIAHITHKPFQPQGKGKIERIFRFIQERLVSQFERLKIHSLDKANLHLWLWVKWYNEKHINRTTGYEPKKRFDPKGFKPLPGEANLDDIFCFKDTRKVDKCNEFSYEGTIYKIPQEHCMVAFKITLHIHPNRFIRIFHNGQFICHLPFGGNN